MIVPAARRGPIWLDIRGDEPPFEEARRVGAQIGASGFLVRSDKAGRYLPSTSAMIIVPSDQPARGVHADIVLQLAVARETMMAPERPNGRWVKVAAFHDSAAPDAWQEVEACLRIYAWTVLDLLGQPDSNVLRLESAAPPSRLVVALDGLEMSTISALSRSGYGLLLKTAFASIAAPALVRTAPEFRFTDLTVTRLSHQRKSFVQFDICERLQADDGTLISIGNGTFLIVASPVSSPAFRLPALPECARLPLASGGYISAGDVREGQSIVVVAPNAEARSAVVGRIYREETAAISCSLSSVLGDAIGEVSLGAESSCVLTATTSDRILGSHVAIGTCLLGFAEEIIELPSNREG